MKHLSTQPPVIPYNAVYDVTEKDVAMMTYRRLQGEQAIWNSTKQPTKKSLFERLYTIYEKI